MRRTPPWRRPRRCACTNSSRVARSGPIRPPAPGSLTREIARMLEIERQNAEPADGSAGVQGPGGPTASTGAGALGTGAGTLGNEAGASQDGKSGGGLLRRARRAVTRPAGPPAAEPAAADPAAAEPAAAPEPSASSPSAGSPSAAADQPPRAGGQPPSAADHDSSAADQPAGPARKRSSRSRATGQPAGRTPAGDAGSAAGDQPSSDEQGSAQPSDGAKTPAACETPGQPATRRRRSSRSKGDGAEATTAPDRAGNDAGEQGAARQKKASRDVPRPEAGAADEAAKTAAPAVQPPLVIFQAPDISTVRAPAQRPQRQQPSAAEHVDEDVEDAEGREESAPGAASRRRRRGGRGRGKGTGAANGAVAEAAETSPAAAQPEPADGTDEGRESEEEGATETAGTAKRRRRRRRTGAGAEVDVHPVGPDDPPNTVVHVRPPREKSSEVTDVKAIKGSTRLEAKRQRRREGRESGRRRPPIITESEFLARREAVERVMVVRQRADRTQIAVLEDNVLVEHYVDKASHQSYVGNVYLGKVQNVLPSMEAAFVDIGKGRNAVLYAGEVNFDASGLEGESKRIESALKPGQSVIVQVTKDPIGHKGARLTSQISLPGR